MSDEQLDIDQDIVSLLSQKKDIDEIEDIIAEMHGESWRSRVSELLHEMYEG
jgi:hypothetical protein